MRKREWVKKAKDLYNPWFKLWYTEKVRSRNGVGIIVNEEWKKDIMNVKRVGDQIIVLNFIVEQDTFNVFSAYVPPSWVSLTS